MLRVQTGLLQPVLTDLLNSCPASMANFIWFIDDKLLKFQHCSHKNAQNDHIHTLEGIDFQEDSAPAHSAYEMDEFLDCKTPDFMPPCC